MTTRKRISLSERQAVLIWQQVVGKELRSWEHEPISVIYPGRASGDDGPDFRDAVIASRSRLAKGDVEVHVKSSDWYSHDHQADAAYNNVILHVVMWHDCDSATLLQNGRRIPVLCLAKALHQQPYLLPRQLPCLHIRDRMDRHNLGRLLTAAGQERFHQKASHFRDRLAREEAGQVLFRGMMRALGYARNTKPFEELARRMPLSSLEARPGLAVKQAMLLGTAGLLPSQRWPGKLARGEEVRELEQLWEKAGGTVDTMSESDWTFSHIYPNNSPVRRIIGQAYLLERYRQQGLLVGIVELVKEASLSNGHRVLETGLTVLDDGYWRNHYDFEVRSKAKLSALLGNSKAGEIAVNVVLPFAFCWGKQAYDLDLPEKAVELYNAYPKLAENEITRHMARQLCLTEVSDFTACHQQGLIHIFRHYCREGRCSQCPLAS